MKTPHHHNQNNVPINVQSARPESAGYSAHGRVLFGIEIGPMCDTIIMSLCGAICGGLHQFLHTGIHTGGQGTPILAHRGRGVLHGFVQKSRDCWGWDLAICSCDLPSQTPKWISRNRESSGKSVCVVRNAALVARARDKSEDTINASFGNWSRAAFKAKKLHRIG